MTFPVFTIGHSTRPLAEFVNLLTQAEVALVADVRTVPRSRTNPQYNRETLPRELAEVRITYDHIADYLLHEGGTVFHILGKDRLEPARMTEAARPGPNGGLLYPANG